MIESDRLAFKEFLAHFGLILPVVKGLFAKTFQVADASINISPLSSQPLVCSVSEQNPNCISVEELMNLFVQRWEQELNYAEEIHILKEKINQKFIKVCSMITDINITNYLQDQEQRIVELLLDATKCEKKRKAEEFCKGLVNGFEIDVIEKIRDFVIYLLWTSFTTPFPLGLIECIENLFQKNIKDLNKENTVHIISEIIEFISAFAQPINLKSSEFKIEAELIAKLDEVVLQRKECSVIIENLSEFKFAIINYRNVIRNVEIVANVNDFIKEDIPFFFERLELMFYDPNPSFSEFVKKIPKGLLELDLSFRQYTQNELISKLQNLKSIKNSTTSSRYTSSIKSNSSH